MVKVYDNGMVFCSILVQFGSCFCEEGENKSYDFATANQYSRRKMSQLHIIDYILPFIKFKALKETWKEGTTSSSLFRTPMKKTLYIFKVYLKQSKLIKVYQFSGSSK
jgi:hypothetical protein